MNRGNNQKFFFFLFITVSYFILLGWGISSVLSVVDENDKSNQGVSTGFPVFSLKEYPDYSKKVDSYLSETFPFREQLVLYNNSIDYGIFRHSSNNSVIIGEEGWLFYSAVDDGDPISCYQGTNLLSEEELATIAEQCVEQEKRLAEQGIEYVLMITPNKERIYSEYMPQEYGIPAENYRALQIVEYLRENTDLRVVYPYDELMTAKQLVPEELYYKTDTHWNNIGGYVGAKALLDELHVDFPGIEEVEITKDYENYMNGDLAMLLGIGDIIKDVDAQYNISGYSSHDVVADYWDFFTYFEYHAIGADRRNIYVIRDSFSTNMSGYVASQFDNSYFRHNSTYTYEDLQNHSPDIVVVEVAERYIMGISIQVVPDEPEVSSE